MHLEWRRYSWANKNLFMSHENRSCLTAGSCKYSGSEFNSWTGRRESTRTKHAATNMLYSQQMDGCSVLILLTAHSISCLYDYCYNGIKVITGKSHHTL